jgi:phenylpyruvate tautomerase PptA (4-oxalocrotonate tautomerase family)
MPNVEILADVRCPSVHETTETSEIARADFAFPDQVAQCLSDVLNISADTVGVFIVPLDSRQSQQREEEGTRRIRSRPRIFVKLHALKRPAELRSRVARELTCVIAEHYTVEPQDVAIYFFERTVDEIAYAGQLVSERS